jgi:hypothetical protein
LDGLPFIPLLMANNAMAITMARGRIVPLNRPGQPEIDLANLK